MERAQESKGRKRIKESKRFCRGGFFSHCLHPSFRAQVFQYASVFMCHTAVYKTDVAFNSFTKVQKKTIRKPKHNNMQSLSISRSKTRGFTAQGSVNKRLNQIELQKMKGKHEWGNEGADVVSDQITISTDYWRGKRLIELFYHTESLRLSPHTKPIALPRWLVGKPHMWRKSVRVLGHTALLGCNVVLFICRRIITQTALCHYGSFGFQCSRDTVLTFGNLSGSPGCLGMTFCSLWNP